MILHFKITPERPQITLVTPEIPKIMHLGHIFFTGPRQTTFLRSSLLGQIWYNLNPDRNPNTRIRTYGWDLFFFFLELELTSPIQITMLLLASWKKIMPVLLMIMMAFFPCGTHE